MLRAIIFPIFRTLDCGVTHTRCCRPPAGNIVGALYYKL